MSDRKVLARLMVIAATTLTPLVGGAVVYYSLRKTHPKTADFGNLMSVAGFALWSGATFWDLSRVDHRIVLTALGAFGLLATNLAIRLTRQTAPEFAPPRS
jgi:hypothetical protein